MPLKYNRFQCDCLEVAQQELLAFKVVWTVVMIASAVVVVYKALTGG